MSSPFERSTGSDLATLIAQTPLCWVVPHGDPQAAILMPVVLEAGADGTARSLLGHLPRRAPATAALAADSRASFLFLGPNSYISPAMAGKADWGPTWNFASAAIAGEVLLDEALTGPALEALVEVLEGAGGWRIAELGARYDQLAAQIVGFRAAISALRPRFKLGQDESEAVRGAILRSLAGTPLGEWMQRFEERD